jgi:hypothetical protein
MKTGLSCTIATAMLLVFSGVASAETPADEPLYFVKTSFVPVHGCVHIIDTPDHWNAELNPSVVNERIRECEFGPDDPQPRTHAFAGHGDVTP